MHPATIVAIGLILAILLAGRAINHSLTADANGNIVQRIGAR